MTPQTTPWICTCSGSTKMGCIAAAGQRRHHLDRTAAVPGALDEPFFLKVRQVLVDGGQRRKTETAAYFLETRRVAVLLDELVEVVQDLALPFGQRKHSGDLLSC